MRRTIPLRAVVLVALVAASSFVARPTPVAAAACSGAGTWTTPPLFYPAVGPSSSGGFALSLPGCTISGSITGWCGYASGGGFGYSVLLVGSTLTFTGSINGEVQVVPDVTTTPPQSCLSGATKFLAYGTVV